MHIDASEIARQFKWDNPEPLCEEVARLFEFNLNQTLVCCLFWLLTLKLYREIQKSDDPCLEPWFRIGRTAIALKFVNSPRYTSYKDRVNENQVVQAIKKMESLSVLDVDRRTSYESIQGHAYLFHPDEMEVLLNRLPPLEDGYIWNPTEYTVTVAGMNPNKESSTVRRKDFHSCRRLRIYERDNFRCRYCGQSPANSSEVKLTLDHFIPISRGGTNNEDNLLTCCFTCNVKKGTKILEVKP